jgi:hypothetical protein
MSHFAELDENNVVLRVLVGDNEAPNEGYDWVVKTFGGTWIKTSYNGNVRKNFAGIGFSYDLERDAFIPPKPFDSWVLDEDTCQWLPPIEKPEGAYVWDESIANWKLFNNEV